MFRLNLSDNTQTSLTYGGDGGDAYTGNNKGFAWLPDSSGYYFTRQENEDLWTMDIDGNWLSQLTNTTFTPCPNTGALDAAEIDPILSYDGTRVIYVKRTIACTPTYQATDIYWQMNADGDLHDSLGISYADAVIHGLHDLVWPETNASSSLTLTLDVDAERLPADHPVDDLYTFRIGETIPLLAQIGAVGTQNINETIRIELMVPRELRPQGMQIQGEDPITLSDLIGVLICLLTGGTDCGDLLNGILEIVLAPETVTYIYDLEGGVVVGQEFPITLDVVGEVVGAFVIEGTAYVVDAAGTGQAMMLSGPESGMLQDSSGGTGGVNSTLGITVAQSGTPTPTNQIDLIAVFPGISNELMDMQAAANNEGLIVHDGPTWNAMKLTIPDGSPWIIPWGSVITVDRQITLPINEIWVRLALADGTNDAWVNLRNGRSGEYTYYTSTSSLDGIPELGGTEIITFTYDRRAAAEYAIAHAYRNSTFDASLVYPDNRNRVTSRLDDNNPPVSVAGGTVANPFANSFLRYAYFVYPQQVTGQTGFTGSAVFTSESVWMGGLPMTFDYGSTDVTCPTEGTAQSGWRYCSQNEVASFAWRAHAQQTIYYSSNGNSILNSDRGVLAVNALATGDGNSPERQTLSQIAGNHRAGGFPLLTQMENQLAFYEEYFDPASTSTRAFTGIQNVQRGDYVYINRQNPDTGHGFLVVGWGEITSCPDALNRMWTYTSPVDERYGQLFPRFGDAGIDLVIPYVVDFSGGINTGQLQRPRPRPFYCAQYDDNTDGTFETRNVFVLDDNYAFFGYPAGSVAITATQLYKPTIWNWEN